MNTTTQYIRLGGLFLNIEHLQAARQNDDGELVIWLANAPVLTLRGQQADALRSYLEARSEDLNLVQQAQQAAEHFLSRRSMPLGARIASGTYTTAAERG